MKKLFTGLFVAVFTLISYGQLDYSRVRVYATHEQLEEIHELGIDIDHGKKKLNTWIETDLSTVEIAKLQEEGYAVEILIEDVVEHYQLQNMAPATKTVRASCDGTGGTSISPGTPADPSNFQLGSMAGFYTYEEYLAELDSMRSKYPSLISAKTGISTFTSHEGRPIYWVRISDNPDSDEAEEEVLYTAIHHAREPAALSQTIYYMWYLLENYGTNEEITYLVDHTEMYFVPMINPDGYKYNHTTSPGGGGMHRKNRNPSVGTYNKGVDLNRNYGYHWDESGTSPDPNNDTYAGASEFSEPETQAIRWFCENHEFKFAFNAHTYGDWLLFPVGWAYAEFAPDHDYFSQYTDHMVQYNGYQNAKSSTLYPAAGDSDDWMYIDDLGSKPKIYAMTPEVGGDDAGFWPASGDILELCRETWWQNKTLAHMPHVYVVPTDLEGSKIDETSGYFNFELERLGLMDGDVTVSIEPLMNIETIGASHVHTMSLMEIKEDSIDYTLSAGISFGDTIKYVLNVDNGLWTWRDTLVKQFGAGTMVFTDDCSNLDNWSGDWAYTNETYVSPFGCITESPYTNYSNNDNKECVLNESFYLENATYAYVTFWAKWEIENDWDYTEFMASIDGGSTWIPLCGKYTNPGSADQDEDNPLYDGFSDWVLEEVDLSDFIGEEDVQFRFLFISDGAVREDGFFFDDFTVYTDGINNVGTVNNDFAWSVYPNPASDNFVIKTSNTDMIKAVEVYNELGQKVYTINPTNSFVKIGTADWAGGVYTIVMVMNDETRETERLVIVR